MLKTLGLKHVLVVCASIRISGTVKSHYIVHNVQYMTKCLEKSTHFVRQILLVNQADDHQEQCKRGAGAENAGPETEGPNCTGI